ncbi:MAG TPA: gamma carbonic anhydrase family protein [Spirochaetota bacterium]|nr:gamma carbonic anhydrase family protein [Spirochaetota bacterium]HPH01639.1 gamma carbonic anhydrase family protein [Spirochaetota bacterium]
MDKQSLYRFGNFFPKVDPSVYIAPGARIVGDVTLGENTSIWWNTVLRADLAPIIVGPRSNIQDNATLHVGRNQACILGTDVLVGHGAICHACTIDDGALIGMGAIILSGVTIGHHALIAAGSLVSERTEIPPQTLWAGNPARCIKSLGPGMLERMREGSALYLSLAALSRDDGPHRDTD